MHLDDDLIQRILDRELAPATAVSAEAHLQDCAGCRERLARGQDETAELHRLLGRLDHPAPARTIDEIVRRARPRGMRWARWAAMLLLAAGLAGVVYAAPGSPLRRWLDLLVVRPEVPPRTGAGRTAPARDTGLAGIAVPPGTRLVIHFASRQAAGTATVTLTASASEVTVRGPAGAATFVTGPEKVLIDNRGVGADYGIEIPAAAPRVEIRLGGDRIFLKDGLAVTTREGGAIGPGPFRLSLAP